MAGDDAAEPPTGAAVLAVLADLRYWADRGVRIAAVEPGEGDGVRVGVTSHPTTAQQALAQPLLVPGGLLVVPVTSESGVRSNREPNGGTRTGLGSTEASLLVPGLVPPGFRSTGPPRQARAASSVIVVPVSALLTGQPSLAASAAFLNLASSMPSTSPRTVSLMPVMAKPPAGSGPSETSACTSSDCGVPPASRDQGRELHRVARRVRRGDQFLGARGAPGLVGSALREAHLERADAAARELHLAGALLEGAVPGGAGGAGGHVVLLHGRRCPYSMNVWTRGCSLTHAW